MSDKLDHQTEQKFKKLGIDVYIPDDEGECSKDAKRQKKRREKIKQDGKKEVRVRVPDNETAENAIKQIAKSVEDPSNVKTPEIIFKILDVLNKGGFRCMLIRKIIGV